MRPLSHCTALLFDGSHAQAQSRLYTQAQKVWLVYDHGESNARERLHKALNEIEAWVKKIKSEIK